MAPEGQERVLGPADTGEDASVAVTGDEDVPEAVHRDRWERASKALQKKEGDKGLGAELLSAVHNRRLSINLLGKAVDVRYPTQAKLQEITKAQTQGLDLKDKLAIQKGDLDALSPGAKRRLEEQAEDLLDMFAPLAAYFIEVVDPSMTAEWFRKNEGGIELAMEIVLRSKEAYEKAQMNVATFRRQQ